MALRDRKLTIKTNDLKLAYIWKKKSEHGSVESGAKR